MAADKEGGTDSLSGVEVCIVDGMDVMGMQNWEHVQVGPESKRRKEVIEADRDLLRW